MATDNWVKVGEFQKYYSLNTALAYELIHHKDFPSMRVGKRAYRVNLSKTDEFFKKYYN